jgi:hypothetical protein
VVKLELCVAVQPDAGISCAGRDISIRQYERLTPQVPASSVIPAEACFVGWQKSLILLTKLVEPEIPD